MAGLPLYERQNNMRVLANIYFSHASIIKQKEAFVKGLATPSPSMRYAIILKDLLFYPWPAQEQTSAWQRGQR
jgi:hypothetical protein